MKAGREGTSRINVNKIMNLPYCYTMEHSFCGPVKSNNHFTILDYERIGMSIAKTLKRYYCQSNSS